MSKSSRAPVTEQAKKIVDHYRAKAMTTEAILVCLNRIKEENLKLHDAVQKLLTK